MLYIRSLHRVYIRTVWNHQENKIFGYRCYPSLMVATPWAPPLTEAAAVSRDCRLLTNIPGLAEDSSAAAGAAAGGAGLTLITAVLQLTKHPDSS